MTNYQGVNDNLLMIFLHSTMPNYYQRLSVFFVGNYPTEQECKHVQYRFANCRASPPEGGELL